MSPEVYVDSRMFKANVNNFGLSRSDLSVEEFLGGGAATMTSPDLGTLDLVEVRKVWNHEERDFTPWLSRQPPPA